MKEYYIYEWYIKDTGHVFYVGMGKNNRLNRVYKSGRTKIFMDVFENNECLNKKIEEDLEYEIALEKEKQLIERYKEEGQCECNIRKGGMRGGIAKGNKNGQYGISPKERMNEDTYKKWLLAHQNIMGHKNPNYGNKKLSIKYKENKELSKEKQSRPREQNGRATEVKMYKDDFEMYFNCIATCASWLIENGYTSARPANVYPNIWKANKEGKKYLGFNFEY